jgi:hypothetical protein
LLILLAALLAATVSTPPAAVAHSTVWPNDAVATFEDLGRGKAIIFSPDLTVPGTCDLYETLGFRCFNDPDWHRVLDAIDVANRDAPGTIETVLLETHGTNGNGLKLQAGHQPDDARSYVSVAALRNRLGRAGVRSCIVSACNSGRLFRPEISARINEKSGDRLFLPATLGIINADAADADAPAVQLVRRNDSHIEILIEGALDELPANVRCRLCGDSRECLAGRGFVVSDLLVQLLTGDPALHLVTGGYEETLSKREQSQEESEAAFARFLEVLASLPEPEGSAASTPSGGR